MSIIKILNLFSGIGGNRKLWEKATDEELDITAVEIDEDIAHAYGELFPDDTVVVGDAHEYLLNHYDDGWDFIWSSPPCPTHSKVRNLAGVGNKQNKPVYPDMRLYQEIIFLDRIFNSKGCDFNKKYVVENVEGYYAPLIRGIKVARHMFWSNFFIGDFDKNKLSKRYSDLRNNTYSNYYGFDVSGFNIDTRKVLRNCVDPAVGLHVFQSAIKVKQKTLF